MGKYGNSYKFYVKENKEETKKYISCFTLYNFIGLFIFGVIFMLFKFII